MDFLEQVKNYIKPELLVLVVVLYFVGVALKNGKNVKDKYIPYILGGIGIFLSALWVLATSSLNGYQSVLLAIFTAIVQGVLVSGASVYVNQLVKQIKKTDVIDE